MKLAFILLSLFLLGSCSKHKVYLVKQWHLSPNESTTDILKSKKLPQFENQMDIYNKSKQLVDSGSSVIIAEGCEESSKYLMDKYNGWNLDGLNLRLKIGDMEEALAPVPMKLKAKYKNQIKIICGDNDQLIKENNLAFSDMKGFSGFFYRLSHYKNLDTEKYNKYINAFKNITDFGKDVDPVLLAKNKTIEALNKFKASIEKRNLHFVKTITQHIKANPVLIVGGLHIKGISRLLKESDIDFEVIIPKEYPDKDEQLVHDLERALNAYKGKQLLYFQTPEGFSENLFPLGHLIPIEQIASKKEWLDLEALSIEFKFNLDLLRSDFDKDGIRDFTLSRNGSIVVIAAEDNDWDNDGVVNLLDNSIGKKSLFKINNKVKEVSNQYQTEGIDLIKIQNTLKKENLNLVEQNGAKHDILILKTLVEVIEKVNLTPNRIQTIIATKPSFQFGKQVFFSYIKQSKSLEIYPDLLFNYLQKKKSKEYQEAGLAQYIKGIVIPILIHSLAHEIGHAQATSILEVAKVKGWNWSETNNQSKYLTENRLPEKNINKILENLTYRGKKYEEWIKENQIYLKTVNALIREKLSNDNFIKNAKKLKWFTKTKNKNKEFQLSFLVSQKLASIYSLTNPQEWAAENFAACIFQKFYPNSIELDESVRYELLMGFNPSVVNGSDCQ